MDEKKPPTTDERLTSLEARVTLLETVVGHNVAILLLQPKPLPGDSDGGVVVPLSGE